MYEELHIEATINCLERGTYCKEIEQVKPSSWRVATRYDIIALISQISLWLHISDDDARSKTLDKINLCVAEAPRELMISIILEYIAKCCPEFVKIEMTRTFVVIFPSLKEELCIELVRLELNQS